MAQRTIAQNPLKPLRGGFGKRGAGGLLVGTGSEALSEISALVPTGRTLKAVRQDLPQDWTSEEVDQLWTIARAHKIFIARKELDV